MSIKIQQRVIFYNIIDSLYPELLEKYFMPSLWTLNQCDFDNLSKYFFTIWSLKHVGIICIRTRSKSTLVIRKHKIIIKISKFIDVKSVYDWTRNLLKHEMKIVNSKLKKTLNFQRAQFQGHPKVCISIKWRREWKKLPIRNSRNSWSTRSFKYLDLLFGKSDAIYFPFTFLTLCKLAKLFLPKLVNWKCTLRVWEIIWSVTKFRDIFLLEYLIFELPVIYCIISVIYLNQFYLVLTKSLQVENVLNEIQIIKSFWNLKLFGPTLT